MKRVLITGANSYIGESFEKWAKVKYPDQFQIDTLDMIDKSWKKTNFSGYDVIFHVAGIVHRKECPEMKELYYEVNTKLPVEIAIKAKKEEVKQFVFMSTMSVYGIDTRVINKKTKPVPKTWYGKSKLKAEKELKRLEDRNFGVAIVRPPMVYGKDCKGNYATLEKVALKIPVFPNIDNQRSMLYIDDLCEFLCLLMSKGGRDVYFPQNSEYVRTSDMVRIIAKKAGHPIWISKVWCPVIWIAQRVPGKISTLINKAFGNLVYDTNMSLEFKGEYQISHLESSISGKE